MNALNSKINIIVTGATGMVGEGVLHVCLQNPIVENILVIGRKTCGVTHPKLKEVLLSDFFNLTSLEGLLKNYNACFFCLGVSSVGMKEAEYFKLTYTLTTNFAKTCARQNPEMTFCYISGASTDSSESGKMMWARVKGKTENELTKIFKHVYNFRPGIIEPIKGMKNTLGFYNYLGWLIPFIRLFTPVCKLTEIGTAMIHACTNGFQKQILEVPDIIAGAKGN